jgi:hypothetical protein
MAMPRGPVLRVVQPGSSGAVVVVVGGIVVVLDGAGALTIAVTSRPDLQVDRPKSRTRATAQPGRSSAARSGAGDRRDADGYGDSGP